MAGASFQCAIYIFTEYIPALSTTGRENWKTLMHKHGQSGGKQF